MITTIVYVHVKEENILEFIDATIINHEASIKEKGNMRFDFLQDENNPAKFILHEAYESKELAKKHKETDHYLTWRKTVEPWMAEKRLGVPYTAIRPL
jgi:(4S)-4-hydroxy-5-phosphonooxypentane-2,3-dione isomerase